MSYPDNTPSDGNRRITELTQSDHHELLGSRRRRVALDALAGRTTPIGLAELAREVAEREDGTDETDEEAVERVMVTLHHHHLPKMGELDVLSYDPESNRVDPHNVLITV